MSTKGLTQSIEWVHKRVASRKGYHPTQETLKRMSEAKLGPKNPMYGRHWKENSKIKLKLSRIGFRHSEETKEKLRAIRLKYYEEHPEAKDKYSGVNNPMFGKKGVLNPMFGKHLSDEAKTLLSYKAIGRYVGIKNPFYGKHHSEETKKRMKEKWKHREFPEKDNKLELKLQQALIKRDISFQKHAKVLGRPDIFVPPNLCVFVDGCYWHGCPCKFDQNWTNPHAVYIKSRIEHDAKVNERLTNEGFVVLRLKEHQINQNLDECVSLIIKNSNKSDINESS